MTSLTSAPYILPAGRLGGENPLPVFRSLSENFPINVDPQLPDEERRYAGWKAQFRMLPHRLQDDYDRERQPRAFRSLVLQNKHLRATFLPELGGRLVSLVHLAEQRELLDRNPVFQPANLAIRNAWFSGGIEWNMGCFGHHHLTCSPVFAARVPAPQGYDILRFYEFDRTKAFPWQIDFHLPPDSRCLLARVRLLNPHTHEIPMYWWSNIAVPETPGTRVLVPADTCLHNVGEQPLAIDKMPELFGRDASYSSSLPITHEFFYRLENTRRPWIAAVAEDGKGLGQMSTARLQGRKMFCWGMGSGGRNWQTYLSEPGRAYIEIQAGLARLQAACLPMPARAEWSWTEAYGMLAGDPDTLHSPDWSVARIAAEQGMERLLPVHELETWHQAAAATATLPPREILHVGSGWGALERLRAARQGTHCYLPVEMEFPLSSLTAEQQPWLELLEAGALPACSATTPDPGAYLIQDEWRWLLERALAAGRGDHWLSWYHLGVAHLENYEVAGARSAWERSLALQPTAWAHRNLSQLARQQGQSTVALEHYAQAWACGPHPSALAIEYAQYLADLQLYDRLDAFVGALEPALASHERMTIFRALGALKAGRLDEVAPVFAYPFATIREGELTLTNLWFEWHARQLAAREKVPFDSALLARAQREFPPPCNIDFRLLAGGA
ncbi:MAG: DUF5107 domain-containing protein [Opitutae bacterium]|nr:DUF5107 domain-containing protein [Opitutae bacterium]